MIYLLRHGQTEWNVVGRLQGAGDSRLTATGQRQARQVAALLAREIPDPGGFRLVSSPLGRAVDTARPVGAALGLAVQTDARLRELSMGEWEGMTWEEVALATPGLLDGATPHDRYMRAPGGEGLAARGRLAEWLEQVDGPTIAVSHGLAGRLLRGLYLGLDPAEALALPVPQDGVFRLADGRVEYLPA